MILVREFLVFFSAFCFISEVLSTADIAEFFPQVSGNLTKVTWSHSINSTSIDAVLKDDNILMIKADLDFDETKKTFLENSDLPLDAFLKKVSESNNDEKIKAGKGKGVKFNFKNIKALADTSKLIENAGKESYPLWLGAQILKGPGDSTDEPLNSTEFLSNAKNFSTVVLSLGWVSTNASGVAYSNDHIKKMKQAIGDNNITNILTFPVRASLAARSSSQLKSLLQVSENATLTIFSGSDDTVDVKKLREVILDVGVNRVFLDIPEDLEDKLRLDLPKSAAATVVISLLSLVLCISAVQI